MSELRNQNDTTTLQLSEIALAELKQFAVQVQLSTIAGAGLGLFATRDFKRGDVIAPYSGELVSNDTDAANDNYILQINQTWSVTPKNPEKSGVGRYANTDRSGVNNNARFAKQPKLLQVLIKATKTIKAGQEILVPYGPYFQWPVAG